MFINSRLLEQQQVAETVSGKQLIRLEKQKKNPYFTRVDFVMMVNRQRKKYI